ncbi:hypothetical protein M8C13_05070 [Crossiella sp. SN42]|uniref:hypothetical protein n=1 Tax=Crossiella sp. SN42 TaxID=2944808 RepID=UPI00207C831E|nr:hypothetical protein [Crossiella sp. SN42]MCO1575129.1 hypothetical protein [Crossiella sp. SN42]
MAVALHLSDLEKMSWIAGAGSFVTGVSSLVVALTVAHPPASRAVQPTPVRAEDESEPVIVHLTTSASRIGARAAGALTGVAWWVGLCGSLLVLAYLAGNPVAQIRAELVAMDPRMPLLLMVILVLACAADAHSGGRDTLIIDADGLSLADRRWISWKNRSVRLNWAQLDSICVRAHPDHGGHHIAVRFKDPWAGRTFEYEHGFKEEHDWRTVLALSSSKLEVLSTVRAALVRYAGDTYQK